RGPSSLGWSAPTAPLGPRPTALLPGSPLAAPRPAPPVPPIARKLAPDPGLDLATVKRTGPARRLVESDVPARLTSPPPPVRGPPPAPPRGGAPPRIAGGGSGLSPPPTAAGVPGWRGRPPRSPRAPRTPPAGRSTPSPAAWPTRPGWGPCRPSTPPLPEQ